MRYFEEHRRKLIKKEKIAGAPSIRQVSEDSELCLNECGGTIAEFSILGNTVQDGTPSPEKPRLIKNSGEYHAIEYTSEVMEKLRSGNYGTFGVTGIVGKSLDDLSTKVLTFSLTQKMQGAYTVGLLKGENWLFGETIQITTTPIRVTGYDYIYVTNVMTLEEVPTLFDNVTVNVIEELTSGSNGIDVELSGVNLFDNSTRKYAQYSTFESTYNGFNVISNAKDNVALVILNNIEAEAGKKYVIDFDCAFFNSAPTSVRPNELHVRATNNEGVSSTGDTLITFPKLGTSEQLTHKQITFTMPSGYKYIRLTFYCSILNTTLVDYKAIFTNFIVSKGASKPYEPYFEPVTVNIPSEVTFTDGTVVPLRFAKYGDIADTLTISNGKVEYIQRIANFVYKEGITIAWYDYYNKSWRERHLSVQFANSNKFKTGRAKGYCSHEPAKKLGVADGRANEVWIGISSNNDEIYWVGILDVLGFTSHIADRENITSEEKTIALDLFKGWLTTQANNGNPFTVEYVIPTDQQVTYDLTDTDLGRRLLALSIPYGNDCIIKVKGQEIQPSLVECVYNTIDETLEDKLSLTVHYKDTEGNELAPSQVHLLRKGTSYSVKPLNIEGYVVTDEYKGVIKENTEITIEYVGGKNEGV